MKYQKLSIIIMKINKYKYITGEEVILSNQSQIIDHGRFTCFYLRKVSERQTKTINAHGKKLAEAWQPLNP